MFCEFEGGWGEHGTWTGGRELGVCTPRLSFFCFFFRFQFVCVFFRDAHSNELSDRSAFWEQAGVLGGGGGRMEAGSCRSEGEGGVVVGVERGAGALCRVVFVHNHTPVPVLPSYGLPRHTPALPPLPPTGKRYELCVPSFSVGSEQDGVAPASLFILIVCVCLCLCCVCVVSNQLIPSHHLRCCRPSRGEP